MDKRTAARPTPRQTASWWRRLLAPVSALAVLLVSLGLMAPPAGATVILSGANAASWPSSWTAYTLADGSQISDLNGDINPAIYDMASGTCASCAGPESSVAYSSDGTNAFFRIRLATDNNDASKGGLGGGAYLVQIANTSGVVKAVVGVDGKGTSTDYVYVTDALGGTTTHVYDYPFTTGSPSSAAMRWIATADGTGQYFLDFQVPLSAIQTVSGGTVTPSSAVKLYYGSSAAANLATINKDYMLGGVTSVDFSSLKSIKFVPPVYAVTFDSTGGTAVTTQNVAEGSPATQPTAPTWSGHVFDGWWTAASGGTQWQFGTAIAGATTLYAHWKTIWTVGFDSNGGTSVGSQNVVNGNVAVAPSAPTRAGYFFDGWFTALSGGSAWQFTTPVTGATTLYAHWAVGYTVSFDSDGGTAVGSQVVRDGSTAVAPSAPTRTGYDFAGWYAGAQPFSFSAPVTGPVALTAHWTQALYTVSFDSAGGSAVADQQVAFEDSAVAPAAPTRTGYDFAGWFAGAQPYAFATPVTGAVALTAHWTKQSYAVTFDANGGSAVGTQQVAFEDRATKPADPERANHVFAGWYTGGDAYDFGSAVTGPVALTAHWTRALYTVSFDSNGGSAVAAQQVSFEDPATQPSDPERAGYVFGGWYLDGEQYGFDTAVTGPVALTAHWTRATYVVTFDANGGTAVDSQQVVFEDTVAEPAAPEQRGYLFGGWFLHGLAYDFDSPVTGSVTLVAHWGSVVNTVSFDSDGGTPVQSQNVTFGVPVVQPADPERTGYVFGGWYVESSAYDFDSPVTSALALTAHWSKQQFTVSFDSAGGSSVGDQQVAFQDAVVVPESPTRTGYSFAGWYADGELYDFDAPVTGGLTLSAHWKKELYTVSFDSDGGSAVEPQEVAFEDTVTEPVDPTRTGYVFAGWFVDEEGYDFDSPVTGGLTLSAHWTKQVYTVSFDANGGSAVEPQEVAFGDAATLPAEPTRTGYVFAGWYAGEELYDFDAPLTGPLALSAHWAKEIYTIFFNSNGGTAVADQQVAFEDSVLVPAPPTRAGFVFDGWYRKGDLYDFDSPVTEPFVISAHWTRSQYTVTFDSSGGSWVDDQQVGYQDQVTRPDDPQRTGYLFAGWFVDGESYDFDAPVSGPLALTAHWTKLTYTVSFDSSGGSAVADQQVAFGDQVGRPTDPERTGYVFEGWYAEGEPFDFDAPVTATLALTAHWTRHVYTVTFDANGGTGVADQQVAFEDPVTRPADPQRWGHVFEGWYAEGEAYDFDAPVTGALTLTAHWSAQVYTVTFDSFGGSAVDPEQVAFQELATRPADPQRWGYVFDGWFRETWSCVNRCVSGATHSVAYDFSNPVTGSITLTAHWTKQVYTVTFDGNGGSAVDPQQVAFEDLAAQPVEPERTGYVFAGWFVELTGGCVASGCAGRPLPVAYDFSTPVTGSITLTAHWSKQVYPVTFDGNGGSAVDPQLVAFEELATEPADPERTGHDFAGWFLDFSGSCATVCGNRPASVAYDFSTPVTGPVTLTAHWTKHVYTVTFDSHGGSTVASQSVSFEDPASAPADPQRGGYTFAGWFTAPAGGAAYDFAQPVEHDVVLHARWNLIPSAPRPDLDSDGDGLSDAREKALGTDPLLPDSDSDGISDPDELNGTSNSWKGCATDPRVDDTDGDGLGDGKESRGVRMRVRVVTRSGTHHLGLVRTNPCRADSDGDGLDDGREVHGSRARHTSETFKSNPLRKDSDRDGLTDKAEVTGRANGRHGHTASNPLNWDTDHGGVSDRDEIRHGSDPTDIQSGPANPRLVAGAW